MKTIILAALMMPVLLGKADAQRDTNSAIALAGKHRPFLLKEQPTGISPAPVAARSVFNTHEEEAALRRKKGAGIALMTVGGASLITGIALLERGIFHRGDRENRIEAGIICLIASGAGLGPGIPMFVRSNKKLKRLKRQNGEMSFHVTGNGGAIVYRF